VSTVVLLGPQRFSPTLGAAVERVGVAGRLASVTAGWQEREAEDLELHEHLGERTVNLMLYARAEDAFERDAELRRGHREKQDELRQLQDLYRIRLGHAQAALRELAAAKSATQLLEPEKAAAMTAIRDIDRGHGERLRRIEDDFQARYRPLSRPAVVRHVAAIERALERVEAVLVAGGHVAVLLNRLRLFGFGRSVGERTLFAWSAGAMALADRVVVFHHSPPQGFGNSELLDRGLGLVRGLVAFPHAARRLRLDDRRRVELLARRFAPDECLALADGAMVIDRDGQRSYGAGVSRLGDDGRVTSLAAA
jgi:hypothetical protein